MALVTIADGTVAVEFRQVPYAVEDVRDAAKRSGRPTPTNGPLSGRLRPDLDVAVERVPLHGHLADRP